MSSSSPDAKAKFRRAKLAEELISFAFETLKRAAVISAVGYALLVTENPSAGVISLFVGLLLLIAWGHAWAARTRWDPDAEQSKTRTATIYVVMVVVICVFGTTIGSLANQHQAWTDAMAEIQMAAESHPKGSAQ